MRQSDLDSYAPTDFQDGINTLTNLHVPTTTLRSVVSKDPVEEVNSTKRNFCRETFGKSCADHELEADFPLQDKTETQFECHRR